LNVARGGDLKDGLRKDIVERNCPTLSSSEAENHAGGHTTQELVQILRKDRFEVKVSYIVDYLKNVELKDQSLEQQKHFMDCLLKLKTLRDHEVEAVRRVFRELCGEPDENEKKRFFPEYP